jgi:hypothetical protein
VPEISTEKENACCSVCTLYQCFRNIAKFAIYQVLYILFFVKSTDFVDETFSGMSKEEMVQNLGTIARSGSKIFVEELAKMKKEETLNVVPEAIIGQVTILM